MYKARVQLRDCGDFKSAWECFHYDNVNNFENVLISEASSNVRKY